MAKFRSEYLDKLEEQKNIVASIKGKVKHALKQKSMYEKDKLLREILFLL